MTESPGHNSNLALPKYKVEVLTTTMQHC